jgi:hypothetical protein
MGKLNRSAKELADMIAAQIYADSRPRVVVRPDKIYGWQPVVLSPLGKVTALQQKAERIATALRAIYDLKDEANGGG